MAVQAISAACSARCTTYRRKQCVFNTLVNSDLYIPAALTFWIVLPDCSLTYNYHSQGVKASPGEQMSQIGDGGERRHVRREPPFPLQLGQLQRAAELVQSVPPKHGSDEHPVGLENLVNLQHRNTQVTAFLHEAYITKWFLDCFS